MCSNFRDPALLGAVQRREWDKLLEVATDFLNWQNPYWNSFHHPEHLAGWIITNFHCAYCCSPTDLLNDHIPFHRAHTDHLLPQKEYPELRNHSMMNAVAACDVCNCMKSDWDPNGDDPIYFGGELTYEVRLTLIERTRNKLCAMSRSNPKPLDIEKVRLAAAKARGMLA